MRLRRDRTSWWSGIAVVTATIVPSLIFADDNIKGLLRRKRIATEISPADIAFGTQQTNVGDLWEQEAAQAELDAERILQGYFSMSIPGVPTPAPTLGPPLACLNGRSREEYFLDVLSAFTDRSLLRDPTTPQGQAFDWMLNMDPVFAVDPCYYPTTTQRYGLLTLYFATNGAQWTNSTNWLGDSSECTWAGVVCAGEVDDMRKLQASSKVHKLNLPFNNLVGTIPEEIATMDELANLNIFANTLTSSLPASLGTLTGLIFLDAERNMLSGPLIPDSLLQLGRLQALRLSRNEFTGTIPAEIGEWTDLEQFWISNNEQVGGTIPTQIGDLTNLKTVFIYECMLEGPVPSEMGLLTELSILRLDHNQLAGPVPDQFFELTNLEDLRLDKNYLTGTLSTSVGLLTGLTDLRLSENLFTGSLPIELAGLTNLQNLIIFHNYFQDKLPDIFENYVQLEQVDVSMNWFSGVIPESIFAIPTIQFVYLSNCSFIGPIPSNFQDPPQLRDLYLDGNKLTGTIPPVQPGRLQELNEILFNYNMFSGAMPQSFCDLRLDAVLDDLFSDCGGPTPKIICDFPDCCNRCFMGERPNQRALQSTEVRQ